MHAKKKAMFPLVLAVILLIVLIVVLITRPGRGRGNDEAQERAVLSSQMTDGAAETPLPPERVAIHEELADAEAEEYMQLLRGFADGGPIQVMVWTDGTRTPSGGMSLTDFIEAQDWSVVRTDEGLADAPENGIMILDDAGRSLYIADTRDWIELSVGEEPHYNLECGLTGPEIVDALLGWAMENSDGSLN